MSDPTPTARRTVLAAGAAVVLAGGTLTACGSEEKNPKSEPGSPSTPQAAATPSSSSGTGTGTALLKSSAVPVGGGTILKEEKLVVTQPTAGSFRCFTAVCTHQGCIVNKVEAGTIDCPCHGSKFQITDGAVAHGPATRPLAEKQITVAPDGDISLA
ncbi:MULTISPECIES: Rieske (2Fe-2S) protein [unclassified Streptomyces]|uniref:Rieske (2Fe-2S) protein n=1 Tax=unclassified Streptomyces TaxID=2593676 RepID=UPI002E109230|nr:MULTISPECIES: Rieske (2Fe-2S) protein [unclassified Streptomyces]WSR25299.1 Rieske (2Fe-2S) protein [Streptomyces sp. NBC_01205]